MSSPAPKWYEVGSALRGDRRVLVHIIKCGRCDNSISLRPENRTDYAQRMWFNKRGWTVGNAISQHLCPAHSGIKFQPVAKEVLDLNLEPDLIKAAAKSLKSLVDGARTQLDPATQAALRDVFWAIYDRAKMEDEVRGRTDPAPEPERSPPASSPEAPATPGPPAPAEAPQAPGPVEPQPEPQRSPPVGSTEAPATPGPATHGRLYDAAEAVIRYGISSNDALRRLEIDPSSTNRSLMSKAVAVVRSGFPKNYRSVSVHTAWQAMKKKQELDLVARIDRKQQARAKLRLVTGETD